MKQYLYTKPGGEAQGPYDEAYLCRLLAEATIGPDTLVCEAGTEVWRPLAQVIDLSAAAPLGQTANPSPPPVPSPRMALFSNGAALLLSLAIVAAACIIAYRPGTQDPVARFKRSAEEKRKKLEEELSACGSKLTDFTFDIRRTNSEITPYEAEMNFRYDDKYDVNNLGEREVQALFRCRDGAWRTESVHFYPPWPTGGGAPRPEQVPQHKVYDALSRDRDTKILEFGVSGEPMLIAGTRDRDTKKKDRAKDLERKIKEISDKIDAMQKQLAVHGEELRLIRAKP